MLSRIICEAYRVCNSRPQRARRIAIRRVIDVPPRLRQRSSAAGRRSVASSSCTPKDDGTRAACSAAVLLHCDARPRSPDGNLSCLCDTRKIRGGAQARLRWDTTGVKRDDGEAPGLRRGPSRRSRDRRGGGASMRWLRTARHSRRRARPLGGGPRISGAFPAPLDARPRLQGPVAGRRYIPSLRYRRLCFRATLRDVDGARCAWTCGWRGCFGRCRRCLRRARAARMSRARCCRARAAVIAGRRRIRSAHRALVPRARRCQAHGVVFRTRVAGSRYMVYLMFDSS